MNHHRVVIKEASELELNDFRGGKNISSFFSVSFQIEIVDILLFLHNFFSHKGELRNVKVQF